jgi:hypothetical protein
VGVGILEGQISGDDSKEDDSTAPDIHAAAVIALASDHFRSCIARRSASCLQQLPLVVGITQSEIDDLEAVAGVQKQIFEFEVPVGDPEFLEVGDAGDELLEEEAGLILGEGALLDDVLEEFPVFDVLGDEEEVVVCFDDLIAGPCTS